MSATEWIAQRRELLDAATEGPWYAMDGINWVARVTASCYELADVGKTSDAELIADARTSLPVAVDALEAVLALADNPYPDARNISGADIKRAIEVVLRGES